MFDIHQSAPQKKEHNHYEDTAQPWHQKRDESDKAYEAFKIYMGLGYSRNVEKVAMRVYSEDWEANIRHVAVWSERWQWEKRAVAYDAYVDDHAEQHIRHKARYAKMKFADAMPDIADTAINIALGRSKGDRVQGNMLNTIMDRGGLPKEQPGKNQNQFNFNIVAPELPETVDEQFESGDPDSLEAEAKALIPDSFDTMPNADNGKGKE